MSTKVSMGYNEGKRHWHAWFDCIEEYFEVSTYAGGFMLYPGDFGRLWTDFVSLLPLHDEDYEKLHGEIEEWLATDYGRKALKRGSSA